MTTAANYGPWHTYWLIWFGAFMATFIAPEIYALCTDWHRTLSASVWYLEGFTPGQPDPFTSWTAAHLLFAGGFALMAFWLTIHFALGLAR